MERYGAVVHGIHRLVLNCARIKVKFMDFFEIIPFIFNCNIVKQFSGGGVASSHGFALINQEFIISANNSKPLLHIWPVNSQEQVSGLRFVVPGKVTALTVSPDGVYCVAAVSEIIYIWKISSGDMLAMLSRHYQTVSSLVFTDDGSHFISAGQDGMMLVWKLSSILTSAGYSNQETAPLYSFSDHTLPVTDIFIGKGGMRAFVASVSLDRTCRIYDLASGTMLLNLVFPEALTSVTIDNLDTKVYVGTFEGNIFEFSLQSPPRTREYHLNHETLTTKQRFVGHKSAVTTLSVSLDGETLLSGGNDETVHFWHIPSKQIIRSIPHKGSITNAKFMLAPKAMFDQETKLNLIANNFKRMIDNQSLYSKNFVVEIMISHPTDASLEGVFSNEIVTVTEGAASSGKTLVKEIVNCSDGADLNEIEQLRAEVTRLKKINKDLFEHSVKSALRNGK